MPPKPATHDPRVSDLVIESKIDATWDPATEQTTHIRTAVGVSARRRRLKTEETWKRKRILGRGAYGTVWLEERIASSGPSHGESSLRAIKEIRKRANVSGYEFHRELEAMAKFSHERFVHCFVRSLGWFESEESLFITMEYLKYGDLQQYLTKPFPEPEAKQISLQIAEALQLMHESGFAHRDLKPGNILVLQKGPAWWVKIADFGISKRVEASTILRTMEIGTRGFMAPEILGLYCPDDFDEDDLDGDDETDEAESDALAYTPAIDLWALGEITHRMLTQKPVFTANKRLWSYVTKGTPFPTSELQSVGTSAQGIEFIQRTMAASPKGRLTADGAINHEWLESHEFVDETRSRSSTESARDSGPTGMTVLDDEPSAQWTATEHYSEPIEEESGESITAVSSQEQITEKTAKPSQQPLPAKFEEIPPEMELEALTLKEDDPKTPTIDDEETAFQVGETHTAASDPQPARSPSPMIRFSQESSPEAIFQVGETITASDLQPARSPPPTTPLPQHPPVNASKQARNDADEWDAIFGQLDPPPPSPPAIDPFTDHLTSPVESPGHLANNNQAAIPLAPEAPITHEPSKQPAENITTKVTILPENVANTEFNNNSARASQQNAEDAADWDAIFANIDSTAAATTLVNSQPVGFSSPDPSFVYELPVDPVTDFTRETTFLPQEISVNQASSPRRSYSWEGRPQVLADSNTEMTITPPRQEQLDTRLNHQVDDTLTPNKRDLKKWWKSFRQPSKPQAAQTHPGIFGVPLRQSITYANVAISLIDEEGRSYVYGYIPIVIAKCGVFLKEKGTDVKKIFAQSGSARRIRELRTLFDTPDRYGKGIIWDGYTVHDAANVFRRYLNDLPEPIVPVEMYGKFCDPLRGATEAAVGDTELPQTVRDFNVDETISTYQRLFFELPPLNRQLLLYILDLLAVFASKSDENEMPTQNLASLFQLSILAHPEAIDDKRLNECILIFWIENQDHFLIGM